VSNIGAGEISVNQEIPETLTPGNKSMGKSRTIPGRRGCVHSLPHHDATDELFMVAGGKMQIALRDRTLDLKEGVLVVIPKGAGHKPVCPEKCTVLLMEPTGTCYTSGALTDMNQK